MPLSEPENRTPLVRKNISAPDGIVGPVEEGLQQVVACVARQQQARVLITKNFVFVELQMLILPGCLLFCVQFVY